MTTEAYRAAIAKLDEIRAERQATADKIDQIIRVDLPEAEQALNVAREAHKKAAAAAVMGEAGDAAAREARILRTEAEDRREALLTAVETLRAREAEFSRGEREARLARNQAAGELAAPLLARARDVAGQQAEALAATLLNIAQLSSIGGNGSATGEAFLRLSGDLAQTFRARRLEINSSGIFPDSRGQDEMPHAEFLSMLEAAQ